MGIAEVWQFFIFKITVVCYLVFNKLKSKSKSYLTYTIKINQFYSNFVTKLNNISMMYLILVQYVKHIKHADNVRTFGI